MHIKATDLVLEVGSGDNPHPRSDILADRYLYQNRQRAGGFPIRIDRPFVVCVGYNLPFPDDAFDYVICSHILEHMDKPEKFMSEVMRVGKAGYIEVPTALSERLFGWQFHHWYIEKKAKQLVLRPKTHGERFGGFFHHLIINNIWFRRFFESHENLFYLRIEWSYDNPVFVIRKLANPVWASAVDLRIGNLLKEAEPALFADIQFYFGWIVRRISKKVQKETRRILWSIRSDFPLVLLRCVVCRERIYSSDGILKCTRCGMVYKRQGNIPIMLTSAEFRKGY